MDGEKEGRRGSKALAAGKHIPENWMAKPCLLVKKSVLNCRTTELKVLCRSLGITGPLSSLRSTPLSTGPSQMRSTSCTSSVSNTRKCSLDREETGGHSRLYCFLPKNVRSGDVTARED